MFEHEAQRKALLESNDLRTREAEALHEANALLAGLARMNAAASPAARLAELLGFVRETLRCDTVAIIRHSATTAAFEHVIGTPLRAVLSDGCGALDKPCMVGDLMATDWWDPALGPFRSLVAVPVTIGHAATDTIVCLSGAPAFFTGADVEILSRLSRLASQALETHRLAERNALLAAVIDGSVVSFAIVDVTLPGEPVIYVNDAFEDLTGRARDEVVGHNGSTLAGDGHRSAEAERLASAVRVGAAGRFELNDRRPDGSVLVSDVTLFPVAVRGQVRYLVATQQDVTRRRQMEQERDRAHARMVAALSEASEGFLVLDMAGAIVFANAPWRTCFPAGGRGWAEGRAFVDVWSDRLGSLGVSPGAALRAASQRLTAMRDGRMESEERLDEGRIVLLSEKSIGDGQCLSVATDITRLKASERDVALRAAAMDEAQDGIAIADELGRMVYVNAAFLALFGFSDETEALGRHWSTLYTAEATAAHEGHIAADLEQSGAWRGQAVGRRVDGCPIEQDLALTLIHGVGMIAITRDNMPRKRAEAEQAARRAQLNAAQRQEALGVIAAGIAHDFNNLLAVISGTATLLSAATSPATTNGAHVARILQAADRAAVLVGRLLDFGKRRTAPALIGIGTVLSDARALIEASVGDGVSLVIGIPSDDVEIRIDPTDLMQVLLNLVINARDASRPGHGSITVTVDPEADPADLADPVVGLVAADRRYVAIRVTDDGTGIADDCLAAIFDPYVSTKGVDGTGLGLTVVAGIVTAADGAVCVRSAPGKTTFTILLPRADSGSVAGTADRFDPLAEPAGPRRKISVPPEAASAAVGRGGDFDGLLILIIDDDPYAADLAAAALQAEGAQVTVCSIADALQAIRVDPLSWDMIVADDQMPGMGGEGLVTAVSEFAADVPILLLDSRPAAVTPCGPFRAVIREPFHAEAFIAVVRGLLSGRARFIDASPLSDGAVASPPNRLADGAAASPTGVRRRLAAASPAYPAVPVPLPAKPLLAGAVGKAAPAIRGALG